MQRVILDTNALLMPFEVRINIDLQLQRLIGDFEGLVPTPLLGELRRSKNRHAGAALALAAKYRHCRTDAKGDDAVVELALRTGAYVLTNDKELRQRLKVCGVKVIFLRSNSHLMLDP